MEDRDKIVRFLYNQLRVDTIRHLDAYVTTERGTLAELKDRFRRFLPEEVLKKVKNVKQFVDALEKQHVIGEHDVTLLRMLAEKLELSQLKKIVEEFDSDCRGLLKRTFSAVGRAAGQASGFIWDTVKRGVYASAIHLKTVMSAKGVQLTLVGATFMYIFNSNPEKMQNLQPFVDLGVKVLELLKGSVVFVLEVPSISSLKQLWRSYKDGSLKRKLKKAFNGIKELKELSQGEEIDVEVKIDEEEYYEVLRHLILLEVKDEYDEFDCIQPTLIQQIKRILDQYPDDGQILKELIQNAEDAKAKEVKFLYDHHSYGTEKLHNPELAKFQNLEMVIREAFPRASFSLSLSPPLHTWVPKDACLTALVHLLKGPALYAYNDATFSTNDWKGVRMLSDSIKEKDPTKVGRFGLGFKSVFHMTDLPSVISGDSVAIIDPEEKYFSDSDAKRSGRKWHLEKHRKSMQTIPDHFVPYKGIFGCNDETFERGSYEGTLFRLPLRQEASKLSDTIYSQKKMKGLLECFEKDAHLILLFLMNLERIEVYERAKDCSQPRRLFHVGISADCLEEVRKAREKFSVKVQENALSLSSGSFPEVKKTYPLTIETVHYNNGGIYRTAEHSYVVTLFFSGSDGSQEIKSLMTNESLSYLPLVGVALPLQPQNACKEEDGYMKYHHDNDYEEDDGIDDKEEEEEEDDDFLSDDDDDVVLEDDGYDIVAGDMEPQGHIFCFLPLPLEDKSLTGLPVHVNGFFALSQNRRHLKWPSADQDETLTDKSLLWNKGLLQEVLPKAYAELVLHVISCLSEEEPRQMMTTSDVYSAWPDINKVDVKWKRILQPFFDVLLQSKILHTAAHGGGWCRVEDAMLDDLKKSDVSRKIVIDLLTKTGINVVIAPGHVKTALQKHCTCELKYVTPKIMRSSLKADSSCYAHLNHQDKILLLRFVLSDSNFQDLHGLELLPLADGTFTTFGWPPHASIYIDSTDHPKSLLPGLQRMFLDTELDDAVTEQLKNAVEEGHTQLRHFNKEAVKQHLRQTLPSDWRGSEDHVIWYPGKSTQLTDKWLKALWEYFAIHFAQTAFDLDAFVGLPLVPVTPMSNQSEVQLARIQRPSSLVLASFNGERIDESVCHVLKNLGLTIMEDLPEYIRHYPELVPSYANPSNARGVLNAMGVIVKRPEKINNFLQRMKGLPADWIRLFRTFLTSLSSLTPNEVYLLQQLPLFETYVGHKGRQSCFVSINEVKSGAPVDVLPDVSVFTNLLDLRDCSSRALAQTLNALPMTLPDFLKILLDDALREKYSEWEVDVLVKYTLERFGIFHGKDLEFIKQKLQCLSFVVCSDNSRKKPTELFNPEDDLLKKIFLGEDVFPKESYYSQPEVNAHLKKLGLKGEARVTYSDVLNSANMVSNLQDINQALTKSSGLLELLEKNRVLLQAAGNGLRSTVWIPVLRSKPNTYSTYLPLKGCHHGPFACPSELTSQEFINVIGSVRLVTITSAPNVSQYFGWRQTPRTEDVLNHLQNVVLSYNVEDKSNFIGAVKEIYRYLGNIHQTAVTQVMGELKWVWNGEGFSSLTEVVLENPGINLSPYVCVLPTETRHFSKLFTRCGMKESCDTDLLLDVLVRIREKHESAPAKSYLEVKRDLQLAIDILNELKPIDGEPFDKDVRKRLLVPVHVEDDARLEMKPVEECTYYDHEWLKQGYDVRDIDDQDDLKIRFIHQNISDATAMLLEVPTLMSRILGVEELEMGESFGQSESLLDRLRGLLDGYTDGLSVPKELIQNADDAGATEVRFLYDERTNENCMTRLIDEGMKECQGPALWAYNDAVFSDEDFQNIVKLNAATKKEDSRKIGRFGLGFNSVYNLTDVPSFVSRDSIVILDPHTTYLGKGIRDKSKPGIKLRIEEKKLRRLENQFKPYNGIFGCDLRAGAQQKSYNGTLFRFPLRTASQAKKSEIKPLYYDEKQVKELLGILSHGAESLLLFTQNVLRVTVYHLRNENTEAPQPVELFRISKSCSKVVHQLESEVSLSNSVLQLTREDQEFVKQSSILKVSSSCMEKQVNKQDFSSSCRVLMKSSMILNCQCALSDHGKEYLADVPVAGGSQVSWLVTSCMVSGKAFKMASTNKGLLPTAGVAAKLTDASAGKYAPVPITKPLDHRSSHQDSRCCHHGSVFCFLPLPIHSGLPVHINGCFAVSDNRRYLRERTEEDKTDQGAEWNDVLMREVVCQTYISMLEDIRELSSSNGYTFYSLWPRCCDLQPNCYGLACQFYSSLSSNEPELFSDDSTWTSIQNVVFLEPAFRNEEPIGQIAFDVFKSHVEGTDSIVIDVPGDVFRSFERYELKQRIERMCYNKERFFREVFFPAIHSIDADSRNKLVLYALDDTSGTLREFVRNHRCIPSSPLGNQLKYPKELLHPRGKGAQLFRSEDGRFPHGEEFTSDESLATLKRLGLRDDDLEWEEVIERAGSVKSFVPYQEALDRTKLILAFIDRKLDNDRQVNEDVQTRLQRVQFLPIMRRPEGFPFKWKGDEYEAKTFLSAAELHPKSVKYLASVSVPILDESKDGCGLLLTKVKRFLAMTKTASLDQVKIQIESVIATAEAVVLEDSSELFEEAKKALELLYSYFQSGLETNKDDVIDFLKPLTFILGEKQLLSPSRVAFHSRVDFPPHLSPILYGYEFKFGELFKSAGVRDSFEISDYIRTLKELKEKLDVNPVTEEIFKVTTVLQLLADAMEKDKVKAGEVVKKYGTIFIPDSKGIMRPSTEVCVKDCYWMPDEKGITYANDTIPPHVCFTLGANTRRQDTLRQHTRFGIKFGQKEKLTNRLKRILTGYPCGQSIMKELLQNADDAKATKVCFIKDPRQHPDERVFEECWKPLQGPALCVYNNAPFTESDIQGIQNLGEGSKGDDPNKTGQYGVGFNAVYHLTDAPTFISQGEEIGEVMCVFDPNLQFAPGAEESSPGVMYDNISNLKEIFTDVFPCYLGEHFPVNNATMFRFALRNEEMANNSEICKTPMTTEDLDELLYSFKKEMLDVLLFVNSVKEISVCEIDKETGNMTENYSVNASLSEEDQEKRRRFAACVNEIGKHLQRKERLISDISVHQVSYVVNLEDSEGLNQKWFVVQKIGFENPEEIPDAVIKSFNKGDLGLLPRGGVASLISSSETPPGKAFCFLPLPFETGLPVHINGHFALDHEARRNLWRDNKGDYRSDWNDALLRQVVAPCYVALLDEIRQLISLPVNANRTNLTCIRDDAEQMLNSSYASLFPSLPTREVYWETLAKEVYRYMDEKRIRLLPVLREDRNTDKQDKVFIEWLPPTGEGQEQAFFGTLIEQLPKDYEKLDDKKKESAKKSCRSLRDTLLSVGVNLLCMSMGVYDNFKDSNVDVSLISPADVIRFFGTYNTKDQLCDVGCLPTDIKGTPFENVDNLLVVLKYCSKDEEFTQHLDGLPLLLTQDGVLRALSSEDPVFLSGFSEIVPHSSPLFVHNKMFANVFYDGHATSPVFKDFNISAFANLLPREMNEYVYKTTDDYAVWNPEERDKIPNKHWIWHVWRFFSDFVKKLIDEHAKEKRKNMKDESSLSGMHLTKMEQKRIVHDALSPVNQWCLLPATEKEKRSLRLKPEVHLLFPIALAKSVIDFHSFGLEVTSLKINLEEMELPELNCQILDHGSYISSYSKTARYLVAGLDDPTSILTVLTQKLKRSQKSLCGLKTSACDSVLCFFNNKIGLFNKQQHSEDLKALPFYTTIHDEPISIKEMQAIVLSDSIPKNDMHIWQEKSKIVFLKEDARLKELYSFLECDSKNAIDLYCDIIFEKFHEMSEEARLEHLKFLSNLLMYLNSLLRYSIDLKKSQDKERLLQGLRKLKFIPDKHGSFKTASSFYDPSIDVFEVMFENQDMFPPKPFCEGEWLSFLCQIGLINEVSNEQFVQFAKEVETEANRRPSDATKKKSQTLVTHLFKIENVATDRLLDDVKEICFIFSVSVDSSLQYLHKQHGMGQSGLSYICFKDSVASDDDYICWTSANILPYSANPMEFYEVKPNYKGNNNLNYPLNYKRRIFQRLEILKEPTVDMVVTHCKTICNVLCQKKPTEDKRSKDSHLVLRIMTSIYKYLQRNYSGITDELKDVRCVVVDGGKGFVFPNQVSTDITSEQEIPPYLYKIPLEIGAYAELFIRLGTTNTVTAAQYSMVLKSIHDESEGEKLHPNEIRSAFKATKGLFEMIAKLKEVHAKDISPLYLPGEKQNPDDAHQLPFVLLQRSTNLMFNDAPNFKERIKCFEMVLLVKLEKCGLDVPNDDLLIKKLPEPLRPRMLTSVVHETLVDECTPLSCSSTAQELRVILTSGQFCHGLIRMIRHSNYESRGDISLDILANVREKLSCIYVYGVSRLRTRLVCHGKTILKSEANVSCFGKKEETEERETWKIYVEEGADLKKYFSRVAIIVDRMTGSLLGKEMLTHLPIMLSMMPSEIKSFLDDLGVREDNSFLDRETSYLPPAGSYINIDDHHLLVDAFVVFSPGDYVGYELDDPSLRGEDGTPTYIYAVVIEEVIEDGQPSDLDPSLRKYRINIGKDREPIVVDAAALYMFQRPDKLSNEGLEVRIYCGPSSNKSKQTENLGEVLKRITKILEEAWKLPEEKRRKIIKRLFLTWHPDKNPGNEEFCTKVFQFIQGKIEKLEKGESSEPWRASGYSYGGSYGSYFRRWSGRARYHRGRSSAFYGGGGFSTFSWSAYRRNPQPSEARRWCKQAKADLGAASNDVQYQRTSYEWACFKCHQSAEKALKAAQFSKDADKTSTHSLTALAQELDNSTLQRLASQLECLVGNSMRMRYPDQVTPPNIPHDVYYKKTASQAIGIATEILQEVKSNYVK